MEDPSSEVKIDPQKILKSCPVKMKTISSFFMSSSKIKPSTPPEKDEIMQKKDNQPVNGEVRKDVSGTEPMSVGNPVVEVEMSYEDFLNDKGLQAVDTETETESTHQEEDLGGGNVSSGLCNGFTKLKEKVDQEDSAESMDTCASNIEENTETLSESNKEKSAEQVNGKPHVEDIMVIPNKECGDDNEIEDSPVVQATGKASILGYFKKSTKEVVKADPGQVSPEIIITKVTVHTEPTNKCTHIDSGKSFSIFDLDKRKTGLESKTSPKTNVIVHTEDFDMGITVLESPVVEEKQEENDETEEVAMETEDKNTPDDTDMSDGSEMCSEDTATEITVSANGTVKKTLNRARKVQKSGKSDKENSPQVSGGKRKKKYPAPSPKTPRNEKKSKKQKTPRTPLDSLDSSQSDDLTPSSKPSGSEKKRVIKFCGECSGCSIEEDCGKCIMCLDKKKFGGPNVKKQKCILRRCEQFFGPRSKDKKLDKAKALLQKAKCKKLSPASPNKGKAAHQTEGKLSGKPPKGMKNKAVVSSQSSPVAKKGRGSKSNTPSSAGGRSKADPGSSEGGVGRSKRRSAQAASKALVEQPSDSDLSSVDVTPCKKSLDFTPKRGRRKPGTPTRPGRKVVTKLAPIFKKTLQDSADSEVEVVILTEEQKERQRIRQEFLRSGVPLEVRKQQQVLASVQLSEYPPVPRVSHVQQIEEGNPAWSTESLLKLVLRDEESDTSLKHSIDDGSSLIDKTKSSINLSALAQFSSHPDIDAEVIKTLVAEINTSNPAYPAKRTYRQLVARRAAAERSPSENVNKDEESSTTADKKKEDVSLNNKKKRKLSLDPQEPEAIPPRRKRKRRGSVVIIEEDKGDEGDDEGAEEEGSKRRLSLRRRSTRKSKAEEPAEMTEQCEVKEEVAPPDVKDVRDVKDTGSSKRQLLWTDKYSPSCSREMVGNSRNVEKFRVWLQDWKKCTDLEMKRLAKELEKQAKKSKKQQPAAAASRDEKEWSDESDFEQDSDSGGSDYMPESEWEIGLCNTMLITGPHGIGKTAMVNALAEELGYKVFEVSACCKRAGKQVLTQLQEATQSHQVSMRNLEDVFTTILSGDTLPTQTKPKEKAAPKVVEKAPMPTAFTNLFNKKKTQDATNSKVEKVSSPRKGKGKKAAEDSPKKKRGRSKKGVSTDDVVFVKEEKSPVKKKQTLVTSKAKKKLADSVTLASPVSRQDSESARKGLDLSSCSLILFEEVDLVFEEDKGFWAAIQTFINTTKRPIVMTTSDPLFVHKFDPKGDLKIETLNMRRPNMVNTATYLQLVALAEGTRTHFPDIVSLVELYRGDMRRCLLALQYWAESGGSMCPLQQDVTYQQALLNKRHQEAGTVSNAVLQSNTTTSLLNIDESANLPKGSVDTDDEFQISKPMHRRNRKAFVIEDDSSMDSFRGSPVKLLRGRPGNLENILEEDDSQPSQTASLDMGQDNGGGEEDLFRCTWTAKYPHMHTGVTESCLCLQRGGCSEDILRQISFGYTTSTTETVKQFFDSHLNIIYLNLIQLLPLPKTIRPLYSFIKFQNEKYTVNHRLSRIKNRNDLFDSEIDSDSETDKTGKSQTVEAGLTGALSEQISKRKQLTEGDKVVMSSIQCLSDLYESFSFADSHLTLCKDKHEWLSPNLNNASLLPGQLDCRSVCDVEGRSLWKHEYANEMMAHIQLGNYSKTCDKLTQLMHQVTSLGEGERGEVESMMSLPVDNKKVRLQTSSLSSVQASLRDTYKSALKNVYQELNPKSRRDGRSDFSTSSSNVSQHAVAMEYMPILRTICKAEKLKEESKTKRRFLHYLDSQRFSLKRQTMETLCTTFT